MKIYVDYATYNLLGFNAIPENRFATFINRAGFYVQEQTFGRVMWHNENVEYPGFSEEQLNLITRNQRGICELAELYFRGEAAIGETGAAIMSFSNEGYREVFESGTRDSGQGLFSMRLSQILTAYFSIEQLSRKFGG